MSHTQNIVVGDCLEIMADMPSDSIDVVVTSPPYNIGIDYNTYGDSLSHQNYLSWLTEVGSAVKRILAADGSFFLNVGSTNKNPWLSYEVAKAIGSGFVLQNRIIWAKSVSVGDTTYGHFKPINSPRYLNNLYEEVFHFTNTGSIEVDRRSIGVPFMDKANIRRFGHSNDKRCKGNVWHIPYPTIQSISSKGNHPAVYPVELAEHCIQLHGITDDMVVYDPFLGTGSTLVAAKNLGVTGLGTELDIDYAAYALTRLGGLDE